MANCLRRFCSICGSSFNKTCMSENSPQPQLFNTLAQTDSGARFACSIRRQRRLRLSLADWFKLAIDADLVVNHQRHVQTSSCRKLSGWVTASRHMT